MSQSLIIWVFDLYNAFNFSVQQAYGSQSSSFMNSNLYNSQTYAQALEHSSYRQLTSQCKGGPYLGTYPPGTATFGASGCAYSSSYNYNSSQSFSPSSSQVKKRPRPFRIDSIFTSHSQGNLDYASYGNSYQNPALPSQYVNSYYAAGAQSGSYAYSNSSSSSTSAFGALPHAHSLTGE